ncbi:hypothetical protein A3709_02985 [Halioglobus sp. HI00S01]|uniref:hypothetical protein n=1 Tax=Halioglobus sp. HI00S01 TaxID=1822214 RepID=UPI0007C2737F|nr:hypothetical protein [Halioglobus sp. HI00S01]KZX58440.1 hypothetical protein A3709_02985 [Halioglobus sp. HI00S01]
MTPHLIRSACLLCLGALVISGCSSRDPAAVAASLPTAKPAAVARAAEDAPNFAHHNPHLADSVYPLGHVNPAQSTGVNIAGPRGKTEALTVENGGITYTHLGPAHFGGAISPEYPSGKRVIWSNGGDRISKLDYDTLDVIAEYPITFGPLYQNKGELYSEEEADELFDMLDSQPLFANSGLLTLLRTIPVAKEYYGAGLAGVYFMLSADNTLYVGGKDSILAYGDVNAGEHDSEITLLREWKKPPEIKGGFNSMNMTYDGWIVSSSDDGWLVMIKQDFSEYRTIALTGAEVAQAWNQHMLDIGRSQGAATWVRNAPAIDKNNNLFIASLEHLHKVIWDGDQLSTDPSDGAWVEPYSNKGDISVTFEDIIDPATGEAYRFENVNVGTGSTMSLMGFGEEDKFVVMTDGDTLMNLTLFWRDDMPEDWQQLPQAPTRRIAGMLPANIGQADKTEVQTEQSVVVGGYGALVVNNAPANKPISKAPDGAFIGLAGHHPDFTPHGVQKFEWNPEVQALQVAWVNTDVSSVNCVPLVSNGSDMVYTVGARDGHWTLEGIDWSTGETQFTWVTGSSRFNTQFSGVLIDQEGRLWHTTIHGIVRYERPGL